MMRIIIEVNGDQKDVSNSLKLVVDKILGFIKKQNICGQPQGSSGWEVAWNISFGLIRPLCKINVVNLERADNDDSYFINSLKRLFGEMGYEVWVIDIKV